MKIEDNYDYCVIGAGAAGFYTANKLSEGSSKVILCDIGNFRHQTDSYYNLDFELEGNRKYFGASKGRSFGIGGTTYLWGGSLIPYTKLDFNFHDSFSKYFSKIKEEIVNFDHKKLLKKLIAKDIDEKIISSWIHNKYNNYKYYESKNLYIPFSRKDFSKIFLSNKINLKLNYKFKEFLISKNKSFISGAKLINLKSSQELLIKADKYFLCTGALESVFHINKLVNDLNKEALNKNDFFPLNDHLSSPIVEITSSGKKHFQEIITKKIKNGYMFGNRYIFKSSIHRGFFHFVIDGSSSIEFDSLREIAYSIQQRRLPNIKGSSIKNTLKGAFEYSSKKFIKGEFYIPNDAKVFLTFDCECPISNKRFIKFENNFSKRKIKWDFDKKELNLIFQDAKSKSKILLESLNFKENIDYLNTKNDIWNPYDAYHPTGILNNNNFELIELPNLKFKFLDNLFCFSTSSLPSPGTANPTYSLLVLIDICLNNLKNK